MPELSTPPAPTLETILLRRDDIPTAALSETEVVMLHMDRGTYFGMEDVAKVTTRPHLSGSSLAAGSRQGEGS